MTTTRMTTIMIAKAIAGSAIPAPPIKAGILRGIFMASRTMGNSTPMVASTPVSDILFERGRNQMVGSNATPMNAGIPAWAVKSVVVAKMIKHQPLRNWANHKFIQPAMGRDYSLPIPEAAIPSAANPAYPKPTRIRFRNPRPKAFFWRPNGWPIKELPLRIALHVSFQSHAILYHIWKRTA